MAAGFDAEAHIAAMAATLGLEISEAQKPGVKQFLELAARMNGLLEAAPVPHDTLELAPVYTPLERGT
ncbi:MAG: DUF4089 domain-containing protein [Minwuia sp.]|uniref:DUF4089 domain-containing protein n=1 Tax=Minwuia sp. TaxID=2493630 RepID=UPI003A8B4989